MAITPISFISPEAQKKTQGLIIICVLAIIFLAWGYLYYQTLQMNAQPMSEMWMPPSELLSWRWRDFSLVFTMWAVMMAAMMLPSALPMIITFNHICLKREHAYFLKSSVFIFAYFAVWLFFSILLTLLQWLLHGLDWLSPMMDNQHAIFAALLFLTAGVYQFSKLKQSCLKYCQSPVSFLLHRWKTGYQGAFRMGLEHGVTCLGCCWAQMLLMFALGVMNLLAMALITVLICLEKLLPQKNQWIAKIGGALFIAWGVLLFF